MKSARLLLCLSALAAALAPAQDLSTPEATIKTFVTAVKAMNFKQIAQCVLGGAVTFDWAPYEKEFKKQKYKVVVTGTAVARQGEGAVATMHTSVVTGVSDQAPQSGDDTIKLTRSGNNWLIIPIMRPLPGQQPTPLASMAYLVAHPEELPPIDQLSQTPDQTPASVETTCVSNVKQLTLGLIVLAGDHKDVLKITAATFKKAVMPYVRSANIFRCPDDAKGDSYSFNSALAGVAQPSIAKPAETVMVYEGVAGKLVFRHGGRAVVGFADGHVRLVTREQAKALRWKPRL